jgi:acyl dehydratase
VDQLNERYLEDFAVGQTFGSGRLRIDGERALAFAAEFDPQPFHLDEAAARRSIFGGLTASGWHTAAVTMRLLVETELKPAGASSALASTSAAGPGQCDRRAGCRSARTTVPELEEAFSLGGTGRKPSGVVSDETHPLSSGGK